jgi:hypothetical protein
MQYQKTEKKNVKYKPCYELSAMQKTVAKDPENSFTGTAYKGISEAELSVDEAVELIALIEPINFYKSMPCNDDPGWYQDVYTVPYYDTVMYIKFTNYPHGKVVISFKER